MSVPEAPSGLREAGAALWESIAGAYDLEPAEASMLATACRQADDVAALEATIESDGYTVSGSAGQPRLNGAVSEVRQGRIALGKLLGMLALPSEDDVRPMTQAQRQAKAAADARWSRERTRRDGAA